MDKQQGIQVLDEAGPQLQQIWRSWNQGTSSVWMYVQYYSQLLWIRLGDIFTQYLNLTSQDFIPRVKISQLNIIYNVPHP